MKRKRFFITVILSLFLILLALFILFGLKTQKNKQSNLTTNSENKIAKYPIVVQKEDITIWKTFKNNYGWSIKYPPDWHIGGSHYQTLEDLIESSGGFWSFYPPDDTLWQEGWLMVSRLIDKPRDQSLESWYKKVSSEAVIPPKTMGENIIFNGQPAYRTAWRACSGNICEGSWQEDVYVVYDNVKTFQIGFNTDNLHESLEKYKNYWIYQQMLAIFKFDSRF